MRRRKITHLQSAGCLQPMLEGTPINKRRLLQNGTGYYDENRQFVTVLIFFYLFSHEQEIAGVTMTKRN